MIKSELLLAGYIVFSRVVHILYSMLLKNQDVFCKNVFYKEGISVYNCRTRGGIRGVEQGEELGDR
jgi:hypothetical protein